MKTYDITIKATVIKTLRVTAESEDEAVCAAHEDFTVTCENGNDEYYSQDTQEVFEITKKEAT